MEEYSLLIAGILIFVAALGGMRSGIATAFLEILAGIVVVNFFHLEANEFMKVMAELGLITLLFMAGLEVDIPFLREKAKESIRVGVFSYTLPFVCILTFSFILFKLSFLAALLYAIALSAASVGIVFPILRRKGPLGPRRKMILSAVMVTDLISMMLLGLVYSSFSWTALVVLLFILIVGVLLPKMQSRSEYFVKATSENMALKLILALLLTSEFLSRISGIDVILIVFVLGMFLSDFVRKHSNLHKEIEAISFGFLTPIFFMVGASLSVKDLWLNSWEVLLLTIISFAATYIATYSATKKCFPNRARLMAVLFNTPMSIGIVSATVGLEKEIITLKQFTVLIGAVVISSFIAAVFGKYPDTSDTNDASKEYTEA